MFNKLKLVTLLSTLVFSASVSAGWVTNAKIVLIYAHEGDRVFIKTDNHNEPPSCAEAAKEWAIDISTDTGKAQYSAALSAAAQGKTVQVHGNHNCNVWGDRETVKYIIVHY